METSHWALGKGEKSGRSITNEGDPNMVMMNFRIVSPIMARQAGKAMCAAVDRNNPMGKVLLIQDSSVEEDRDSEVPSRIVDNYSTPLARHSLK